MRELIALRAKIDLLQQERENDLNECGNPDRVQLLIGACLAYENVRHMIDDMVSKQLEDMYEEHLQEEAKADEC